MKVRKVDIPEVSMLTKIGFTYDYSDSYEVLLKESKMNVVEAGKLFFGYTPVWVKWLLGLRDRIVSVSGLKTSSETGNENMPENVNFEPGDQAGIFKVYNRGDNEIVMGEDDKHLNFRVSLLTVCEKGRLGESVILTTVVKYNNWFGRLYFALIKPFHKLIVRMMLKKNFQ